MDYDKKLSILDLPIDLDTSLYSYKMSRMEDFYYSLCAFYDNIVCNIRSFFIGVYNLFVYAPIIFSTREYDYDYLLKLIEFKLKRMKKQIYKDNLVVETPEICKQIQHTLDLIYRYNNHTEIYELENQDKLREIINEKDKTKADKMKKDYFISSYEDEQKTWGEIWSDISLNMLGWWD